MLKKRILKCKKEEFGRVERRKQDCLQKLAVLDQKGMSTMLSEQDLIDKVEGRASYNSL